MPMVECLKRIALMPTYEKGDHVKVEFKDDDGAHNEWMWVKVERCDDSQRLVFGTLDNEPVVHTNLRLGMECAISFDNIREHMRSRVSG